jgi:hypothetical protein
MWFETEDDINIVGTTLTITWGVDVLVEEQVFNTWIDIEINTWDEDLTWLEELNLEIEKILWTDDESDVIDWSITWNVLEEEFNEDEEIVEEEVLTWSIQNIEELTWANGKDIDLHIDPESEELTWDIAVWNDTEIVDPEFTWLTDTDYDQIENVFWNLVE